MSDRRTYKLGTRLDVLLAEPITSAARNIGFRAGEIVHADVDPAASVRIYRNGSKRYLIASMSELAGAEIVAVRHD